MSGLLSLILICSVPDRTGFPPSTAVRMSLIKGCFSRSNALSSTSSADIPCRLSCVKCSFGLSVYVFTELLPVSAS
uniref:Secreted protein n=1 Tax=Gouania willdenowi TaxID=441366 RepID=A0A8C5DM86_GOUWI